MKRHLAFLIIGASLSVILTVPIVASWKTWSLDRDAIHQQRSRAEQLALKLEAQLAVSEQIARSTAAVIAPSRKRAEIETLLEHMLTSTSPRFVYGIGIWYEPWRFDPSVRLFGPYVHRGTSQEPVLTYEWSTPAYDYPSHTWYRVGKSADGRVAFTEPYFDIDYVYMTTTRAFYDAQGEVAGVVSVDLILPQLQEIIARHNVDGHESFFVTTRAGKIFAHPDEAALLAWARARGRHVQSLLDLDVDDLKTFEVAQHRSNRTEITVPVRRTGWQVHVSTDPSYLFSASARSRQIAAVLGALAWGLVVVTFIAYLRWHEMQNLSRTVAAQRESLRVRDEFLVLASHELKTPLTPLLARLQLMRRHLLRGRPLEPAELDAALVSTAHLNAMINDLLDASRVATGRLTLKREPMSLDAAVREVIAEFSNEMPRHPLRVELPASPLWCLGDRVRLRQVVANLIENAIKYSPGGCEIRVRLERSDGEATLTVADRGIGIPRDQQPRLFERYFRARNVPSTSYGGLGLGLYVCREIVVGHGGRISAESEEGEGTTFYVTLPLLQGGAHRASSLEPPAGERD